jgi:hypothetical protein
VSPLKQSANSFTRSDTLGNGHNMKQRRRRDRPPFCAEPFKLDSADGLVAPENLDGLVERKGIDGPAATGRGLGTEQ